MMLDSSSSRTAARRSSAALPAPELSQTERWVEQTAAGDVVARKALIQALWPRLERFVASQASVQATTCPEDCARDVTLRVIERLVNGLLAAQYLRWRSAEGGHERFLHWVLAVTRNETLDYVRQLLGRRRATQPARGTTREVVAESAELPSRKRLLNMFTESLTDQHHPSTRPPFTNARAAKELIEVARREGLLSEVQLQVLALWLHECSSAEIEDLLQLEAETAEALRRAAVMKLRRHFGRECRNGAS